jgi:hypothetical protein
MLPGLWDDQFVQIAHERDLSSAIIQGQSQHGFHAGAPSGQDLLISTYGLFVLMYDPSHQLAAAVDIERPKHLADVKVKGMRADPQMAGGLLFGIALHQPVQGLPVPG